MKPFKLDAKEIPSGKYCSACSFGHHYYSNEEDEVGITHCGLFDVDVEVYEDRLPECLEKFPYGGTVMVVAKEKPKEEGKDKSQ